MKSMANRRVLCVAFVASIVTFGAAGPGEAGPYLFRSIETSPAQSQKECNGQIVRVLRDLQKEKRLTVAGDNPHLATTKASTVHVDCIFVGPNEQRRNQWIFYIAIASTDREEAQGLLALLRKKFGGIVRID